MSITVLPNVEAIVSRFLREHDAINDLVGQRVAGSTPRETPEGWIRITQIAGSQLSKALYFGAVHLQVECYGSNDRNEAQSEASLLARTALGVLETMPAETVAGAVVTAVRFGDVMRIPDTELEKPRERYIFDTWVWAHPS